MRVTAGDLRAAAVGLGKHAADLDARGRTHGQLAQALGQLLGRLAQAWDSPRGRALRDDGEALVQRHRDAANVLTQAATALSQRSSSADAIAYRLGCLERDLADVQHRMAIAASDATRFPAEGALGVRLADLQAEHRRIERAIETVHVEWSSVCRSLASVLEPLDGELRRLARIEDLGRREAVAFASAAAAWIPRSHPGGFGSTGPWAPPAHGDVWFDALVAARLAHPELGDTAVLRAAAAAVAGRVQRDIDAQIRDGAFDADTIAMVEALLAHDHVAVLLFEELGAAWLTTLAFRIEDAAGVTRWQVEQPRLMRHDAEALQANHLADAARLLDAFAHGLTIVSHDTDRAPGVVASLLDAAREEHGATYGLSQLLHRAGPMGRQFTLALAAGVYAMERADGGPAALYRRSQVPSTGGFPRLLDPPHSYDLMTGVFAMLGRDPAAAQDFLLAGDPEHGTRLHYLTTDRHHLDGGLAFGEVVVAAAGTLRDHDPAVGGAVSAGHRSARIASEFLRDVTIARDGGFELPGIAPAVATLLGVYGWDVQQAILANADHVVVEGGVMEPPDRWLPQDMAAWGIRTTAARSLELIGAAARDEDALVLLLAGQDVLARAQLAWAADQPASEEPLEAVRDAAYRSATYLSTIVETVNAIEVEDAIARDRQREIFAAASIDAIGAALPASGLVVGAIVGTASGVGQSLADGRHEKAARQEAREVSASARRMAYAQVETVLLNHGLRGEVEAAFLDDDGQVIPAHRQTPEQATAWNDHLTNHLDVSLWAWLDQRFDSSRNRVRD